MSAGCQIDAHRHAHSIGSPSRQACYDLAGMAGGLGLLGVWRA